MPVGLKKARWLSKDYEHCPCTGETMNLEERDIYHEY